MKIMQIQPTFNFVYQLITIVVRSAIPVFLALYFLIVNFNQILDPLGCVFVYIVMWFSNFSVEPSDYTYKVLTVLIMFIYAFCMFLFFLFLTNLFYKRAKFIFNETNVTYTINFLIFHQKHVNYSDIKEINLNQGPLQRLFGLATIKITTHATTPTAGIEIYNITNYSEVYNLLMAQTGHQR